MTDDSRAPGTIQLSGLRLHVGAPRRQRQVVSDLNLEIAGGQFLCLLGVSGCGKSTLLNAIAGFLRPSGGTIDVDGQRVLSPAPDRGVVFQQQSLFPWKTALDNVAFGPKMRGESPELRRPRALQMLDWVGLRGYEQHYPGQLSGGMQQRVEIARALINQPQVLLMDEPFGALDAQTRFAMQQMLLQIWSRMRTTVVFVTHDIDEAIFLADRVVVMGGRPGRILAEFAVGFARPRDLTILTSRDFVRLKRDCLNWLNLDFAPTTAD